MNYFSSDFHFGHKSIVDKYRTSFLSCEEHDDILLSKISKLKKRDILFILGDFIFPSDDYEWYIGQLSKMSCRFKVVMGNHDSVALYGETIFEIQLPLFSYKKFWLSHCPIHPQEIRGRFGNIHGHLHNAVLDDKRYFDVGLDKNNFELVPFDNILERFKKNELFD